MNAVTLFCQTAQFATFIIPRKKRFEEVKELFLKPPNEFRSFMSAYAALSL